jgi:hypothetical protein
MIRQTRDKAVSYDPQMRDLCYLAHARIEFDFLTALTILHLCEQYVGGNSNNLEVIKTNNYISYYLFHII